jgi:exo-1,4-beta-D-glucosaminidase
VETELDLPSLDVAHLTVRAEVRNAASHPVKAVVRGTTHGFAFSQPVALGANETRTISFTPQQFEQLNIKKPTLWWPHELGKPVLHDLVLDVETGGRISDREETKFGIVQVTSELTPEQHRLFRVNGKPILIRGGGWAPDMLLRGSRERLENELRYTQELGLNTIRLEGKLESDEFFDLADREGILIMAGWCCCDHWEKWGDWKPEDRTIAAASLADQAMRLRRHPSVLAWLNGSDIPPPADVEQIYLDVLKMSAWARPVLSSATGRKTTVSGESGVKMTGPYDYVPPNYWLEDTKRGGAFGFNTETGPGPAVPPVESLRAMIPAEHLWPADEVWNYHAGSGRFAQLNIFNAALAARYGKPASLEDYVWKSQVMAYEGERAMFEAYRRNPYAATGVIQWMLNNAWPSLIWHLYDYFLRPGGGYFGTRKANEPLHVQYSYDDRSIAVVNSGPREFDRVTMTAKMYDLDLSERFSHESVVGVPAGGVVRAIVLPAPENLSATYFLRLSLRDAAGKLVSSNFYWLSTRPDTLDWEKGNSFYTPQSSFADFTAMAQTPQAKLEVKSSFRRSAVSISSAKRAEGTIDVTISNPSKNLALFVRARLLRGQQKEEVLPVFWSDGYFELLPGEAKEVRGSFYLKDLRGVAPAISVDAWNAAEVTQPIRPAR